MTFVIKIFFISILFAACAFSQSTLQLQYEYAEHLFKQEKYFDSITELKRLQFFDLEKEYLFESNYLIAQCYKAGGKFDEAVKYFTLAEISAGNDSDYFNSKIFIARANILRRTNLQAERILNELLNDARFTAKHKELNYWLGWSYIFSDDWEKAQSIFSSNNLDTVLAEICENTQKEMYSVGFAKYSSYIIPGLGQFYTEEYLSGLLSFGWNLLGGYLTINSLLEDRVFDGIIVGNFLWMRFYSGNTENAEKFAIKKNLDISNTTLNFLQHYFPGEKP